MQVDTPPDKRREEGLYKVFKENFPITDARENFVLEFLDYYIDPPRYAIDECKGRGLTFSVALKAKLFLYCTDPENEDFEPVTQEVYLGNIPYMSNNGTFIINGAERVVVSQLHRSPGVFFGQSYHANGTKLYSARVIPFKGSWIEFSTDVNNVMYSYIDRKKKFPVTTLMRAIGYSSDKDILEIFGLAEEVKITLQKDNSNSQSEAVDLIYRQLRNAEPPDEETARGVIDKLFFSDKRYDLGEVGRYRLNKKLHGVFEEDSQVLTKSDIIKIVEYLVELQNSKTHVDDIDHLSNRRVRTVGEQLYSQFSVGLARMARTIRERMNIRDNEIFTPADLINARTLSSVINSFFGTNQLSQFLDQTNPLAELTHKRRVSALGPGGLSRERAGFEVRDVHYTHYGRLCPIETPEGPNIGLISSLCTYAKINDMGFIETPYRKVETGNISPVATYLSAEEEDNIIIAQSNAPITDEGTFVNPRVKARKMGDFPVVEPEEVAYMDVAPNQIVSVAASLIPFLENDDANRALMGSNMQRQAVPLLKPEAPIVGTGIEGKVAEDSRSMMKAEGDGVIEFVDGSKVVIRYDRSPTDDLNVSKFRRTNQNTCVNLRPVVKTGDKVENGTVIADGYSTEDGELALGKNLLVAFMPWQGYNFEDAIVISERVVAEDVYTSLHIEEFDLQVRDTKRGEEELTREIPNVSEDAIKHLDENGLIRIGAEVNPGDILIGKITPKGESDPTPEEKLLRAIFGDKAGDVKDASLRVPPSIQGVVIDKKLFSKEVGDELPSGILKLAKVYVAKKRKLKVGDKMAGRHGNKGVVARIVPVEDMPFLDDGTPVDIVLNPLGVPSRMNLGQVYESILGWAGKKLGMKFATPIFDGASVDDVNGYIKKANLPDYGVARLINGQTGEKFSEATTVGVIYMLKLIHLVDDKMHARSIGPYSLITQQPLGGKAQFGGQRFGEMEVWALEAFGAAHVLREMLTVKSDDVVGRAKVYESIVKGDILPAPGVPESFNVLIHELRGLALEVTLE
ncbi:UNVERIFIED_CONTAM: hypothetical protein GTU68_023843 [Idotea baltica]|nr:hypothetical protein [Idotea baltica]